MPPRHAARRITSRLDRSLEARIVRRVPMHYADGADTSVDRPGHVRAASSMAWVGQRVALVQDDVNFVALVDPTSGLADAVTLPAGKDDLRQFDVERGNKKHKLDLEALTRVPSPGNAGTTLLAFGSGSKKRRENVITLRFSGRGGALAPTTPTLVPLPELYAALRAETAFAGSEMNIEGALYLDGMIRLFGRGNGEASDDLHPVDATCDLDWRTLSEHIAAPTMRPLPSIGRVTQYDLGALNGVALGFTDAIPVHRTMVMYAAAAEASPDATRDGAVGGSALGMIPNDRRLPARWTPILDERGRPFDGKVEGLVLHRTDPRRALVVVDVDDHTRPSELCEVVLEGGWFTG
ncbi:MAG: hypothetical protein U5K74_14750 [Gemmatimonadaceae bacterium]|nr:hypothetical protein [Gemmatimonadaceae bacterium]